jgi:ribosomal protein S18 acetylase RimI-like enzyme
MKGEGTFVEQRVALRPATDRDREFLLRVYASTREDEMALVDWDVGQKGAFLRMQFDAQDRHYRQHYTTAQFQVILLDGEPVGRLYVDHWPDEIRVVDIAVLTEHRGQGIGTLLMRQILAEGERLGLPVRVHVEQFNPALRFYVRLGFRTIDTHGPYYLMERTPTGVAGSIDDVGAG